MHFNNDELTWLAEHFVARNEFASTEPLPDGLEDKLQMFFKRVDGTKHYEVREEFHSPTLHANIARRRKELGLA
jgi:hypothetical protein